MSKLAMDQLLVDIFYYDYAISEAINIYNSDESPITATSYLQVATVLSKELRTRQIKFDNQLYMKEAYLKLLQMIKFYKTKFSVDKDGCNISIIIKGFGNIRSIVQENADIEKDPKFLLLETVAVAIYHQLVRDGRNSEMESIEDARFIGQLAQTERIREASTELSESFSAESALKLLEPISFERPVMDKFVEFVKGEIDNNNH